MRFSRLAPLLTLLLREFGEIAADNQTVLQEDCCGSGWLTSGVRTYKLKAGRRDVTGLISRDSQT